jgi:hypothetical protein
MGRGGCDKSAIVTAVMVIGMFYVLFAGLLLFFAITLASNNEASIMYGSLDEQGGTPGNIVASISMVFIATIMCPLACLGAYSARAHNKFLLVVYCGTSVFLMMTLNTTGGALLTLSDLPVDTATQVACLQFVRKDDIAEKDCELYFTSKRVEYIRALWLNLYDRGMNKSNPEYKIITAFMIKMQRGEVTGGSCCGFNRPSHCTGNSTEICDPAIQDVPTEKNYESTKICTQGNGGCVS